MRWDGFVDRISSCNPSCPPLVIGLSLSGEWIKLIKVPHSDKTRYKVFYPNIRPVRWSSCTANSNSAAHRTTTLSGRCGLVTPPPPGKVTWRSSKAVDQFLCRAGATESLALSTEALLFIELLERRSDTVKYNSEWMRKQLGWLSEYNRSDSSEGSLERHIVRKCYGG